MMSLEMIDASEAALADGAAKVFVRCGLHGWGRRGRDIGGKLHELESLG